MAHLLAKKLVVALLLAPVLVVTACGGGDDDDGSEEAARSTTSAEEMTTTAGETTTTVAAEGPAEWVEALRDIEERRFALFETPDPASVAEIYAEECTCWDRVATPIQELTDLGHHIEGEPRQVLRVWHQGGGEPGETIHLTAEILAPTAREVDAEGNVVQEFPSDGESACVAFALRPEDSADTYRVTDETVLTACPA